MEIIPAIDIKEGRCVRLFQGDYSKVTVYSSRPEEVALSWQEQGAGRLHVVDLEAAATGKLVNIRIIKNIREAVSIPMQVGGGLRTLEALKYLEEIGVERFVLGTAAIENEGMIKEAHRLYGEKIVIGIDLRDGKVQISGWLRSSGIIARDLLIKMRDIGIKRFIITDISRDGTLTGPNFSLLEEMAKEKGLKIIASGGISTLEHISKLGKLGLEGAIIGKALYSGDIRLREALEMAKDAH